MHELINRLRTKQLIWQGSYTPDPMKLQSTGFHTLDEQLGGGFPSSGVIEIKSSPSIGELRLLWPHIKTHRSNRMVVFIQPPGKPCAEQLLSEDLNLDNILIVSPKHTNDALWAAEKCLKSGACSHVLLWQKNLSIHHIRRLQIASEQGECLQFIFKGNASNTLSLPVSLSMTLQPHITGLEVEITKRKGGWPQGRFLLGMNTFSLSQLPQNELSEFRKLG